MAVSFGINIIQVLSPCRVTFQTVRPIYMPTNTVRESQFFHTFISTCCGPLRWQNAGSHGFSCICLMTSDAGKGLMHFFSSISLLQCSLSCFSFYSLLVEVLDVLHLRVCLQKLLADHSLSFHFSSSMFNKKVLTT